MPLTTQGKSFNFDTSPPTGFGTAGQVPTSDGQGGQTWGSPSVSDASITAAKLAADAVETAKILDGNVTTGKIANNAVTGAKIAMGSDATGDVLYYDGTDYVRLGIGATGKVLTVTAGVPAWETPAGGGETVVRVYLHPDNGFDTTSSALTFVTGTSFNLVSGKTYETEIDVRLAKNTADTIDFSITDNNGDTLSESNLFGSIAANTNLSSTIRFNPNGDGDYLRITAGTPSVSGDIVVSLRGRLTAGTTTHKFAVCRPAGTAAAVSVKELAAKFTQLD